MLSTLLNLVLRMHFGSSDGNFPIVHFIIEELLGMGWLPEPCNRRYSFFVSLFRSIKDLDNRESAKQDKNENESGRRKSTTRLIP